MQTPLVSIIIPTYNRAHLIGETLDSVLEQTYTNWECIVVDDGSTDDTAKILSDYCGKDRRFQYYQRPKAKPKGANSCRNYGFELSEGEYVNWFDSDDLMTKDFIKIKVETIERTNVNFVFSKSLNFDHNNFTHSMFTYDNSKKEPSTLNFVTKSVSWCTLDFLGKRDTLNSLGFNITLNSGQEYNFFSRYLCQTNNGLFIDEFLALRRVHKNSIQGNQKKSKYKYRLEKYLVYLLTYKDIKDISKSDSLNHLLGMSMSKAFDIASNKERIPFLLSLIKYVYKQKGFFLTSIFGFSLMISFLFKKGYFLMKYSRNFNLDKK